MASCGAASVVGPERVDPVSHGPEALSLVGVADLGRGQHWAATVRRDLHARVCAHVVVPGGVFVIAVIGRDDDHVGPVMEVEDRVGPRLSGFRPGGGEQR